MNRTWARGFEVAKAAALLSNARHARRVGAALYSGSTLLSIGYNEYGKSHPKAVWNMHAEHRALLRRQYHVSKNLIVYVFRETADGKEACSKPCSNCAALMKEAGVRLVRYLDEVGLPQERLV